MHRPTITSSLTFSIMAAASPATSARSTGARYRFQNRNSSPAENYVIHCSVPLCISSDPVSGSKYIHTALTKFLPHFTHTYCILNEVQFTWGGKFLHPELSYENEMLFEPHPYVTGSILGLSECQGFEMDGIPGLGR